MALESSGCFGESVLTGRRRQATHVAAAWCETLVLTKDDLIVLFEKNPRAGKRIVKTLLAEVERKEKLQLLLMRFIIGSLPKKSPVRNALVVQKAWSRYTAKMAAAKHTGAPGTLLRYSPDPPLRKFTLKKIAPGKLRPELRKSLLRWAGEFLKHPPPAAPTHPPHTRTHPLAPRHHKQSSNIRKQKDKTGS